jgi:hypothetical protein
MTGQIILPINLIYLGLLLNEHDAGRALSM